MNDNEFYYTVTLCVKSSATEENYVTTEEKLNALAARLLDLQRNANEVHEAFEWLDEILTDDC